jgi:hypothetical protein
MNGYYYPITQIAAISPRPLLFSWRERPLALLQRGLKSLLGLGVCTPAYIR